MGGADLGQSLQDSTVQRRPSSACRHLLPAGGEKNAFIARFRQSAINNQHCRTIAVIAAIGLLPVHGEKMPAGR
jgi:hypothetical protein